VSFGTPDLTEAEWKEQIEKQDKWYIEMNGFLDWRKSFDRELPGEAEESREQRRRRVAALELWSRENSCYDGPTPEQRALRERIANAKK